MKFVIQKQKRLWQIVEDVGLDLDLQRNKEFELVERKKEYSRLERSKEKKDWNNCKLCDYVVIMSSSFLFPLVSGGFMLGVQVLSKCTLTE